MSSDKIIAYLEKSGFTKYAQGYMAKLYGKYGILIFDKKESMFIDKHLLNGVRKYAVKYVKDVKRIIKDINECN